ncbi:MAG: AAA family ATPase [Planctomycetes bacterium]|nr:AAA family ATPase [Planctomycetota bacterium]
MILTRLTLKDWKHLKFVRLPEFKPGINVIHGPNRAGKSTIAEAIRFTLVDFDHNSGRREVQALTPWIGGGLPSAEVGFVVNSKPWTLEKRFSKNKDGGSELFGDGANKPTAEGKEATTEVQRLLGVAKSSEGLGGLLWMNQGDVQVPAVDTPLGDALRQRLGVLVASGDSSFRKRLGGRLEQWFTPKGKDTKAVTEREKQIEELRDEVRSLRKKREDAAYLVDEHENKRVEHQNAHEAVEASKDTIKNLEPKVKALDERKNQLKDIERRQRENEKQQEDANADVQDVRTKAKEVETAEVAATTALEALEPLKEKLDGCEKELLEAKASVVEVEERDTELRKLEARVAALRKLEEIERDLPVKRKAVESASEIINQIGTLKEEIAGIGPCDENDRVRLDSLVEELRNVEADLRASAVNVSLSPDADTRVELVADGENQDEHLSSGTGHKVQFLREAEFRLHGWGAINIKRGDAEGSLREQEQERDRLRGEIDDLVGLLSLTKVERGKWSSELVQRAETKKSKQAELKQLDKQLEKDAPDGVETLVAAVNRNEEELAKRKKGIGLVDDASILDELEKLGGVESERSILDAELRRARSARDTAQQNRDSVSDRFIQAEKAHSDAEGKAGSARELLKDANNRTDGEDALKTRIAKLSEQKEELDKELAAAQLTDDEARLEETLAQERQALTKRSAREREISDRLRGIEGELKMYEGLHGELAAAEQRLTQMEAATRRDKLDAEAHRLICDWFDEAQEAATQRSLAPVSDLVHRWLRILNGDDQAKIEFDGSSLTVQSLNVSNEARALESATSYGEREQIGTLVRLAYAAVLAKDEPQAVILDDPLAHSDPARHRRMLDVLSDAAKQNLQLIVMTCHPERFDQLTDAHHIDLQQAKTETVAS